MSFLIRKFFLFCSGAHIPTLFKKDCLIEQNKYAAIGLAVLCTALMASLSGGYALFTVFGSLEASTLFGAFWGVIIFNLDRFFILSARKKKNDIFGQFKVAMPRLLLACLLGVVITKPLELRLFNREIEEQIDKQRIEEFKKLKEKSSEHAQISKLETQNKQLKDELEEIRKKWLDLETVANQEAEGTSGTRQTGKGIVYKEKREAADELKQQMEELSTEIQQNNERIHHLKESLDKTVQSISVKNQDGVSLLKQLAILEKLAEDDPLIGRINLFITLLFIMIEVSPVMVKLMSRYGPYDAILETEEERVIYENNENFLDVKQEIGQEIEGRKKIRANVRENTLQKIEQFLNEQFAAALEKTANSSELAEIQKEIVKAIVEQTKAEMMKQARLVKIVGREIEEELNKVKLETIKQNVSDSINQAVTEAKVERFFSEDIKNFEHSVNGNTANKR